MAARTEQLSKAPLAEVVFELRWDTGVRPNVPVDSFDPGFPVLQRNFPPWAARAGMSDSEEIKRPDNIILPYVAAARFRKSKEELFPLWQIGPGVYAANDSSSYKWGVFKKHSVKGLAGVLKTYPVIASLPFKPISLELRYWDFFDGDVLGNRDLVSFINDSFDMNVVIPKFCQNPKLFEPMSGGILRFAFPVKGQKNTVFGIDVGVGRRGGDRVVRMESKVTTRFDRSHPTRTTLLAITSKWLEMAHRITSPFFKTMVKPEVMEKFR